LKSSVEAKSQIKWVKRNFPPVMILDGYDKNKGYVDRTYSI
jgi:hypothetical protein